MFACCNIQEHTSLSSFWTPTQSLYLLRSVHSLRPKITSETSLSTLRELWFASDRKPTVSGWKDEHSLFYCYNTRKPGAQYLNQHESSKCWSWLVSFLSLEHVRGKTAPFSFHSKQWARTASKGLAWNIFFKTEPNAWSYLKRQAPGSKSKKWMFYKAQNVCIRRNPSKWCLEELYTVKECKTTSFLPDYARNHTPTAHIFSNTVPETKSMLCYVCVGRPKFTAGERLI